MQLLNEVKVDSIATITGVTIGLLILQKISLREDRDYKIPLNRKGKPHLKNQHHQSFSRACESRGETCQQEATAL